MGQLAHGAVGDDRLATDVERSKARAEAMPATRYWWKADLSTRRAPSLPDQARHNAPSGRMVACGDDALAECLAAELRELYRMRVAVVEPLLPGTTDIGGGTTGRARATTLLTWMQAVVNWVADSETDGLLLRAAERPPLL
ncbi:hypothetical protein AB0D27_07495 [Streptomyces sp. NPDC048415]|uniref:hypothetical protein n=1 Tax=Streptomyces sp. NPDC048415 TaxID=3154822 RepID=UPI00341AE08F